MINWLETQVDVTSVKSVTLGQSNNEIKLFSDTGMLLIVVSRGTIKLLFNGDGDGDGEIKSVLLTDSQPYLIQKNKNIILCKKVTETCSFYSLNIYLKCNAITSSLPSIFTFDIFNESLIKSSNMLEIVRAIDISKDSLFLKKQCIKFLFREVFIENSLFNSDVMDEILNYAHVKDKRIFEALTYMVSNIKRKITVGELSRRSGLCNEEFSRVFKKNTGISPLKLHRKLRLLLAKRLLLDENCFLYEVSDLCGFDNYISFSLAFKKEYGESPSSYRKANSDPTHQ